MTDKTRLTRKYKSYEFDPKIYSNDILSILNSINEIPNKDWDNESIRRIFKKFPKDGKGFFSKDQIIAGYRYLVGLDLFEEDKTIEARLKLKPMRTQSGVATVTVLTKPFPCPGMCIFCPNDVKMPKSYLSDEPGAQRAERNNFSPYLQTYNRLQALHNTGHTVGKVELIVLGGTWSFYPTSYQIWFIKECFRAMNDFGVKDSRLKIEEENIFEEADRVPNITDSGRQRTYNELVEHVVREQGKEFFSENEHCDWDELEAEQKLNETAKSRCVGLVIETRPDYVDEEEVLKIRRLGATKVQVGLQSMNDKVQSMNQRGHGRREAYEACQLLRRAGFKIHAHWMPNLYGSTPEMDIEDYAELWDPRVSPDELKIYPCSIIDNTILHEYFKEGKFRPYTYDELLHVLSKVMPTTPRFCRLTRVVRDIPSTDIVAGNKLTNFRQIAEKEIEERGGKIECIRSREIKFAEVTFEDLELEEILYETPVSTEHFLSYKTKVDDKICGFLRLSLPKQPSFIEELGSNAIIREIHVYGNVVPIGKSSKGESQHLGLGTLLMDKASEVSKEKNYDTISVITAIGTREYYRKKGFEMRNGELYMHKKI